MPTKSKLLAPKTIDPETEKEKMKTVRAKQKFYYDRGAKDLDSLQLGQNGIQVHPERNEWRKATVSKQISDRSYEAVCEDGQKYRRNRIHLRKSNIPSALDHASTNYDALPQQPDTQTSTADPSEIIHRENPSPVKLRRSDRQRKQHTPYVHIP